MPVVNPAWDKDENPDDFRREEWTHRFHAGYGRIPYVARHSLRRYGAAIESRFNFGQGTGKNLLKTLTGTGHAREVVTTVIGLVKDVLHKHTPSVLSFGASNQEPSRVKLYDFLAKRVSQLHPDYVAHKDPGHPKGTATYSLIHKDAVADLRERLGSDMPQQLAALWERVCRS